MRNTFNWKDYDFDIFIGSHDAKSEAREMELKKDTAALRKKKQYQKEWNKKKYLRRKNAA